MRITLKQMHNFVRHMLRTRDEWALNAFLRIYKDQTSFEVRTRSTTDRNWVGFTRQDAKVLTSFAIQYHIDGCLSREQMEVVKILISKYSRQVIAFSDYNKLKLHYMKQQYINQQCMRNAA